MSDILRILDRGYELIWREGRLEDALGGLEDDFEWVTSDIAAGDVRYGPDAVIDFFRDWFESWDELHVDWELHEASPERALAIIKTTGRGRASGVPTEMEFAQIWTFRGRQAKTMVLYNDVDEARRAAGLAP